MKRIFAVCGEKSGDWILQRLTKQSLPIWHGVFSPNAHHDVAPLFDGPKELGVMGLGTDLVLSLPRSAWRLRQTETFLLKERPQVLLTVDSKAFSLRLQTRVRRRKLPIKSVHVVAPSIWAFTDGVSRARKLIPLDALCCVLPFEPYYWHTCGTQQHFAPFVGYFAVETLLDVCGAPQGTWSPDLLSIPCSSTQPRTIPMPHEVMEHQGLLTQSSACLPVVPASERKRRSSKLRERLKLTEEPILGVMPGSRVSVVRSHLPVIARVLEQVLKSLPHLQVIVMATEETKAICQHGLVSLNSSVHVVSETHKADVLCSISACLACSGTIVTELLMFQVPCVVMYCSGGLLTQVLARHYARVKYVTLCNIMAGRAIVPEFLFEDCQRVQQLAEQVRTSLDPRAGSVMVAQAKPYLDTLCLYDDQGRVVRPSSVVKHIVQD